jgi:large subunit ribosomal protein L15
MQLHDLKRKTKNKKHIQVGRGGKRGKTAGRGTKGQRARSGRKIRPEIRDAIKKLPKLRGYAFNTIKVKPLPVTISAIEKAFENGAEITIEAIVKSGLISIYKGKNPRIKIIGDKKTDKEAKALSKKFVISGVPISKSVKEAIEKAGGEVKEEAKKLK